MFRCILTLFSLTIILHSCKKDDPETTTNPGAAGGDPVESSTLDATHVLIENDVIQNDDQIILDLDSVDNPLEYDLEFAVDFPFVVDEFANVIRLGNGYAIDADETEDPNVLEAQNTEAEFVLYLTNPQGVTTELEYKVQIEDITPDWYAPSGGWDNAYALYTNGNPYPFELNGETIRFAYNHKDHEDGVAIDGTDVLKTYRTNQTYDEIVADVDDNELEFAALSVAQVAASNYFYLSYIYDSSPENVFQTFGGSVSTSDWGKGLTHLREQLEAAGYPFSSWSNGGIYGDALDTYCTMLEYAPQSSESNLARLWSQAAADYILLNQ